MAIYADRNHDDFAAFNRYAAREIALDTAARENPEAMQQYNFARVRHDNYQALLSETTRAKGPS